MNNLLGKNIETKNQPSYANDKQPDNDFKNYFVDKISTINVTFDVRHRQMVTLYQIFQ